MWAGTGEVASQRSGNLQLVLNAASRKAWTEACSALNLCRTSQKQWESAIQLPSLGAASPRPSQGSRDRNCFSFVDVVGQDTLKLLGAQEGCLMGRLGFLAEQNWRNAREVQKHQTLLPSAPCFFRFAFVRPFELPSLKTCLCPTH